MKKYFLTGLVILLPIAVTVWAIVFIVRFLTKPFMGLMTHFVRELPIAGSENGIRILSEVLILISLVVFTFFLGLIARRFFFNRLIEIGDKMLYRIPLVNKVYKTSKELVTSLFASQKNSFKQVVLLHFPSKDSYCIGLIASPSPKTFSEKPLLSVFIPTTPNPTTGFLVMMPKDELIYLNMKAEDAFKYVVSCAMILPKQEISS